MSNTDQQPPEEETIATDLVVTKYKMGAEIVNGRFNACSNDVFLTIFLKMYLK